MSDSAPLLTRRAALKTAAAALTLPWLGSHRARAAEAAAEVVPDRSHGIHLGLASYSLAALSVDQVIPIVRGLGLPTVSLYHDHAPWSTGTVAECRAVVEKFAAAGIRVTSTGVVNLPNDEAIVRKACANIRGAGLVKFCGRPDPDAFPLVEKLLREYDLRVAIHTHGPSDLYPTAADVMKAVAPYDERLGLCLDVGHAWLGGEDPAAAIRAHSARLYEVHLKDSRGPRKNGQSRDPSPVAVGRGAIDFKAIIAALVDVRFAHEAEFEYEEHVPDRAPGLYESAGYVRGLLAGA